MSTLSRCVICGELIEGDCGSVRSAAAIPCPADVSAAPVGGKEWTGLFHPYCLEPARAWLSHHAPRQGRITITEPSGRIESFAASILGTPGEPTWAAALRRATVVGWRPKWWATRFRNILLCLIPAAVVLNSWIQLGEVGGAPGALAAGFLLLIIAQPMVDRSRDNRSAKLLNYTFSGDIKLKQQAEAILVKMRGGAAPTLLKALASDDKSRGEKATSLLFQIGTPVIPPIVRQVLASDDLKLARRAAAALTGADREPLAAVLRSGERDAEPHVRARAFRLHALVEAHRAAHPAKSADARAVKGDE
jgi:hypothetical protein